MSAAEFEAVVLEWAWGGLPKQYGCVRRIGGSGDRGVDVAAYVGPDARGEWDCFQCKHYASPLDPTAAVRELGKLFYHVHCGALTLPRKYRFVAPQGVGPTVTDWIRDPRIMRDELLARWEGAVRRTIRKEDTPLAPDLRQLIEGTDLSFVGDLSPTELMDQHAETPYHAIRFGLSVPRTRPEPRTPPPVPGNDELRYVQQVLEAYSDHLGATIIEPGQIPPRLKPSFDRQRQYFFRAEALQRFSRDITPDDRAFEDLKTEVHGGVIDWCEREYRDGLDRMQTTLQSARQLSLTSNVLVPVIHNDDLAGICHHLSNEDRLTWVQK